VQVRVRLLVIIVFVFIVLSGCSATKLENEGFNEEQDMLQARIIELEETLEKLEREVETLNKHITLDRDIHAENTHELRNTINMYSYLLKSLPNIEIKQGYIADYLEGNQNKYFVIDYAVFVTDGYSSSGFHIKNEVEEKDIVKIVDNLEMYIGEYAADPRFPSRVELNSSIQNIANVKQGFYQFYFIEGILVLVQRIYIP